jgi:hypothetical protein
MVLARDRHIATPCWPAYVSGAGRLIICTAMAGNTSVSQPGFFVHGLGGQLAASMAGQMLHKGHDYPTFAYRLAEIPGGHAAHLMPWRVSQ